MRSSAAAVVTSLALLVVAGPGWSDPPPAPRDQARAAGPEPTTHAGDRPGGEAAVRLASTTLRVDGS